MNFIYPNNHNHIPDHLIHGTTTIGINSIIEHGIQSRGFNVFGKQNPPSSLDFGEGFYCTYDNPVCKKQAYIRAKTKAESFLIPEVKPVVIEISVDRRINQDRSLKCIYFDGSLTKDGLEWAEFIVFHRVNKDKKLCIKHPCNGHPDIIIGPVADGNAITKYAHDAYNGKITLEEFYKIVTKASWFPKYKQIVFNDKALKYLKPVLKL
jgi:Protein of unknown function (DUF3990)